MAKDGQGAIAGDTSRVRQKLRAGQKAGAQQKAGAADQPFAPLGHFYSPIGNRAELRAYFDSDHYRAQCARVDAMLDYPKMRKLWDKIAPGVIDFPFTPDPAFRYSGLNNQFPHFDGAILSAMIRHLDPKRIVEIGAGWSSAAVFDTLERMAKPRLEQFTTIDPDLSRIEALNPPESARMLKATVQSLGLEPFTALKSGDLLFIDSSHVLKTGSDVHYEYLHILPALAPGVIVHIHDIHYPFEYPPHWVVRENRSWNEVYLVDMLLTHGKGFEVKFFNDAFLKRFGSDIADQPMMARFAAAGARPMHAMAGSIWLVKR